MISSEEMNYKPLPFLNESDNETMPVIIYHEGDQEYLNTCVTHTRKFNKRVILLGDCSNKNFCDEWYDASEYVSDEWNSFLKVFENYSFYGDAFSKQICKRIFAILSFINRMDIDEFVLLDSDILSYINYSNFFSEVDFDVALCIPYENEHNYIWTANIGISYWTKRALKEFVDFYIDCYRNKSELLMEKWSYHKKNKLPGGVSEMTIAYLWSIQTDLKVVNASMYSEFGVFDYNVMSSENYYKDEYVIDKKLRIKKIEYNDKMPYFINNEGIKVRALAVHFLGPAKKLMKEYSNESRIGIIGTTKAVFLFVVVGYLKKIYRTIVNR